MKAAWAVTLLGFLAVAAGALQGAETPDKPVAEEELRTDLAQEAAEELTTDPPMATEPMEERPSLRSVSELANVVPEISASLDRLQSLVVIAIGLSLISVLISTLVLLSLWRRRNIWGAAPEGTGGEGAQAERWPATAVRPVGTPKSAAPFQEDPPRVSGATQVPPPKPLETAAREQAATPPEPEDFSGLPHAAIGRALGQLHRALPALARQIPDARQQERFLAELDLPLKARVERFKDAARRGDGYLEKHWIEQDLVTTLNTLSQMLSSLIEERYRGRRGNRALEDELQGWLYELLAPICQDEGWFAVESVLPFTTRFDPKIHHSVGSVPIDGAGNLIVAVKSIGRRDARQGFVTHKAEVLVGR